MFKYITKRVVMSLITLLVIVFLLFLMLDKMPGSPFNDEKLSAAQILLLNAKYGLDQPFIIRFFRYTANLVQGDFGVSYAINKNFSVASMMAPRILVSLNVGMRAMIVGTIIGLLLGVIAALNHNGFFDTLTSIISVIGVSVPSYVFAILLDYQFGYKMGIVPFFYDADAVAASTLLPVIALSLFTVASVARFTRSELLDVLDSEYILLVKSKGVKQSKLIRKHALRNALIPVITVMGPLLVGLLTGSMVIEQMFAIPGIGSLMVEAILTNDYNVVIACAFVYSALYVIVMLIVDVLYGVIDPRIRVSE